MEKTQKESKAEKKQQAAAAKQQQGPKKHTVRVVSYNVLSSELSSTHHFTHNDPEHLFHRNRYKILQAKLTEETTLGSVICLQEVSRNWSAKLHVFFTQKNYNYIPSLYGDPKSGYMGVAVAFPNDKYFLQNCSITRVAETIEFPKTPRPTFFDTVLARFKRLLSTLFYLTFLFFFISAKILRYLKITSRPPKDSWNEALQRRNTGIFVRLRTKTKPQQNFCVGVYHMPCVYYDQAHMILHASFFSQMIEGLAKVDPYILAGDWNFKPLDPPYALLTEGKLKVDKKSAQYPVWKGDKARAPKFNVEGRTRRLRSVYKEQLGSEPELTNYAWTSFNEPEPFYGCLDYIFVTDEFEITSVKQLPTRTELPGPLPSATEPSDHLLIATDLILHPPKKEQ
eukprot:TRINITY_DN23606_c0_g1_i1.p1 TRINITY_DN23606_c0_g1~~TRINITY_DN23606_c0_g1_i1.p1  ORF type:complete len:396 (-),score=63.85 TRINITY_DN23606_c0_g1_i1:27-1214(-)